MKGLAETRDKKGFTQTEMADKLKIPISTYHLYENNKRKIPFKIAEKICKILGVKLEEIFLPSTFAVRKTKAG